MFSRSVITLFAIAAVSVHGLPIQKRIAQVIADSTAKWEKACLAAGGAEKCNPVSVTGFTTLLAAAAPCDQQDSADAMIDLAKTLNNDPDMIKFAQLFAQQPRNTPTSLSVQYCDKAPKNSELNGLFHCQFASANPTSFVGGVAVGGPNTIPFGLTAAVSPAGSCPASPSAPVADGAQLTDTVDSPGTPAPSGATSSASVSSTSASAAAVPSASAAPSAEASPTPVAAAATSSTDFHVQNGIDAQALNTKFATLSVDSPCQEGDQACIAGGFAQCTNSAWVITQCVANTVCQALPLVNKAGVSLTCDTKEDAAARIQAAMGTSAAAPAATPAVAAAVVASSATDCMDDDETSTASAPASTASAAPAATTSSSSSPSFRAANGAAAKALNDTFSTFSASDACADGAQACVGGGFAQCVGKKWVITQCSAPTTCLALPLVNAPGTSISCDTAADAAARISAAEAA